ncbi:MAG: hypothetical protein K6V73_09855 [Firmicutes bacterium]|nr:hypothetical protein [Bacillota bacterium]
MILRAWRHAWVRARTGSGATLVELMAYLAVVAVLTLAIAFGLLDVYRTGAGAVAEQAARTRVDEAMGMLAAVVQAQAPGHPTPAHCPTTNPSAVCLWDAAGPPQGQAGPDGGGRGGAGDRTAGDRARRLAVPARLVVVQTAPLASCAPPPGMYGAVLDIDVLPPGSAGAVARYTFAVATPAAPGAPDAGGAFVPWPNGGPLRLVRIFLTTCGTSGVSTAAAVATPATLASIGGRQGGG